MSQWYEILTCDCSMKAIKQYFPAVLIILLLWVCCVRWFYLLRLWIKYLSINMHWNKNYWAVVFWGAVCCATKGGPVVWVWMVVLIHITSKSTIDWKLLSSTVLPVLQHPPVKQPRRTSFGILAKMVKLYSPNGEDVLGNSSPWKYSGCELGRINSSPW